MAGVRAYCEFIPQTVGERVVLSRGEAHHISRVLRVRVGEMITLFDGRGAVARGMLDFEGKAVVVMVEEVERVRAPSVEVELVQAMLKGKAMDSVLRGATECGVTRIVPLVTEHGEVRLSASDGASKVERWREIAIESCKQSGNLIVPDIAEPQSLSQWFDTGGRDLVIVASLQACVRPLREILEEEVRGSCSRVSILIGPEGDFSETEYAQLRGQGVHSVRLGAHVLRAGTAAVYALSVVDQFVRSRVE